MIECRYKIGDAEISASEAALDTGQTVELSPMRDGSLRIRTVKRKEIQIPWRA